ncbi:MAG: hypothetical protein IPM18_00705 [Phycisphaerales bacterium]|nr:hypothetical protein [Phycisphaerales bacterium]
MSTRFARSAAVSTIVLFVLLVPASAEMVTYQLDPQQSFLELTGGAYVGWNNSYFGFGDQGAGSRIAHFGGQITGDLVDSTLSFAGTSHIVGLEHPLPAFDPPGPGVDVFGAMTFALNGSAANRFFDIALELPSGSATHGSPLTAPIRYGPASMAHTPFLLEEAYSLAANFASNTAAGPVSLTQSGSTETLVLPVDVFIISGVTYWNSVQTRLQGQLVATRVIPEPATFALLLLLATVLRPRG